MKTYWEDDEMQVAPKDNKRRRQRAEELNVVKRARQDTFIIDVSLYLIRAHRDHVWLYDQALGKK